LRLISLRRNKRSGLPHGEIGEEEPISRMFSYLSASNGNELGFHNTILHPIVGYRDKK
jgi:hypothetical protein